MIKRFLKLISFIILVILILIRVINLISYVISYLVVCIIDIVLIPFHVLIWLIIGKNLLFGVTCLIRDRFDRFFEKSDDYLIEKKDLIINFIEYK